MLDSLSELSGTRRIDLDARLQDLQIEPSRVDVQPVRNFDLGYDDEDRCRDDEL